MPQLDANRRFQIAYDRACAEWAKADPARAAALSGCTMTPSGVVVPYFGRPHLVTHPAGGVFRSASGVQGQAYQAVDAVSAQESAHMSIAIVLLHYLVTSDGTPPADRWLAFRELPDGLFYAQAFAGHAEALLASKFGANLESFRKAAIALGGAALDLADASYRFQALPRVAMAALVWEGDEEFPGQARMLFDAGASHYLPTEDLAGVGDWLAHRLTR